MVNPAIVSLAILKVNWDRHRKDYLENFVPLVAECVKLSDADPISGQVIQEALRTQFGLRIPQNTVKLLLNRLRKTGCVEKKKEVFYKNPEKLQDRDFSKVRNSVLREHDELIRQMIQYVAVDHKICWSVEEAEAALTSYLRENQVGVINAIQSGSPIENISRPPKSSKYLAAMFLTKALERNGQEAQYLDTVAKGYMLANGVFFPGESLQMRFRNTTVYFDTSFLIYVFGCFGLNPRLAKAYSTGSKPRFRRQVDGPSRKWRNRKAESWSEEVVVARNTTHSRSKEAASCPTPAQAMHIESCCFQANERGSNAPSGRRHPPCGYCYPRGGRSCPLSGWSHPLDGCSYPPVGRGYPLGGRAHQLSG